MLSATIAIVIRLQKRPKADKLSLTNWALRRVGMVFLDDWIIHHFKAIRRRF
jgi:hypothetical protein